MITLQQLLLTLFPGGVPTKLTDYALVVDQAIVDAVRQAQQNRQHRIVAITLTDGRRVVNADVLSEGGAGGLFANVLSLLPPTDGLTAVPWYTIEPLLPEAIPDEIHPAS